MYLTFNTLLWHFVAATIALGLEADGVLRGGFGQVRATVTLGSAVDV
jgi:hypothetical protein